MGLDMERIGEQRVELDINRILTKFGMDLTPEEKGAFIERWKDLVKRFPDKCHVTGYAVMDYIVQLEIKIAQMEVALRRFRA